jgi:ParB family chromosome partitioning protein
MDNNNYKRRALGKGLEELFSSEQLNFDNLEEKIIDSTPKDEIIEINLDELRPNPYQPRKVFDEEKLQELADSIKEHGVFQPIIVKKSSIKGYEIIAGERRVKASKMVGLETIPAIVRDFSDEEMMEIALLENLQRENLNAIEEALAYKKLLDSLSLTQEELGIKLGKSRTYVTNMLGLINLPEEVKDMIIDDKISTSHARILSKISDKDKVVALANRIVDENINVRDLEELAKDDELEKNHKIKKRPINNAYTYVENILTDKLGTKVKINNKKINISFVDDDDLSRIVELIGSKE